MPLFGVYIGEDKKEDLSMKKTISALLVICMFSMMLILASCSAAVPNNGGSWMGSDGGYGGGLFGGGSSADKGGSSGGDYSPLPPSDDGSAEGGMPEGDDTIVDGDLPADSEGEDTKPVEPNVVLPAGMITAGAWNDNDYYQAWLDLFNQGESENGKFYNYTNPKYSWGFTSLNRVKVCVKSGENAVAGATVVASDEQGNSLFSSVTDAAGNAYLFTDADNGQVTVTSGDESATANFSSTEREFEIDLASSGTKLNVIEIMLVVDVTGSMGDEISFLKAELADVINRIAANDSETVIKLAMLFYRDTDDKVPFDYYDFTDVTTDVGLAKQQDALDKQKATGGGDYPEAVDEALDIAVNKQWSTGSTTKIIFQVLDAPAHEGDEYANKLVNATKIAAEKGIRICPIICSGAEGSTEYTMREAAVYTGGTFIFVTDDSGIGGSHHDPGLPNVTVELLNSLMVRLVKGYHTGNFEDPIYWKQDPGLATNK